MVTLKSIQMKNNFIHELCKKFLKNKFQIKFLCHTVQVDVNMMWYVTFNPTQLYVGKLTRQC